MKRGAHAGPGVAVWATVAAIAIGVAYGYALRWTSDDAFITFRYLDQWFSGNGLVYNPGERVEGYTHPLWLWLLGALRSVGAGPVPSSWVLGLVAFAGLLALVGRRYPVAALGLAVHQELAIWSTGGLETSLFTFEVALLLWLVARWERTDRLRPVAVGLLSVAIVLTRPDGALFALVAGALLVLWAGPDGGMRRRISTAGWMLLPIVALMTPYLFWKISYYGQILPNTYYAKSGGGAFWSQGFYYLWAYLRGHPVSWLLLLPLLGLPSLLRRGRRFGDTEETDRRTLVGALLLSWTYLILFVVRVGGDFMYARFVVPVLPLLFVSLEIFVRRGIAALGAADLGGASRGIGALTGFFTGQGTPSTARSARPASFRPAALRWSGAVLWLLPLLVLVETPLFRTPLFHDDSAANGRRRLRGIEDERWYWSHDVGGGESQIERYERLGKEFTRCFDGIDVTVSILGQASLGYYGRFPRVVEENGLTEPMIARRPLAGRGRVGHEKRATIEDLCALGVDIRLLLGRPTEEPYRIVYFQIEDYMVTGELPRYDPEFLTALISRNPETIRAMAFPEYFDYWVEAEAPSLSQADLAEVADRFERFYFRYNPDPERRRRLEGVTAAS